MANGTFNTLGTLETSMAAGDIISFWKTAGAGVGRITKANMMGGVLTGGGTIVTGGFTLTVPATGTAALLATAQTFTTTQTIAPASGGATGQVINMGTGTTAPALNVKYNNSDRILAYANATQIQTILNDADLGSGNLGPGIAIGRNTNGSTPAAGWLKLTTRNNLVYYLWIDNNAKLRIGTTAPTNTQDESGTIVGTQS